MPVVRKFTLLKPGISSIPMPSEAVVLSGGMENRNVVLWAQCPDNPIEVDRKFLILPTDATFPTEVTNAKFVCTLLIQEMTPKGVMQAIIHVFDLGVGQSLILPS